MGGDRASEPVANFDGSLDDRARHVLTGAGSGASFLRWRGVKGCFASLRGTRK